MLKSSWNKIQVYKTWLGLFSTDWAMTSLQTWILSLLLVIAVQCSNSLEDNKIPSLCTGSPGIPGSPGLHGSPGQPGRDGRDGRDAQTGEKGDRGDGGEPGTKITSSMIFSPSPPIECCRDDSFFFIIHSGSLCGFFHCLLDYCRKFAPLKDWFLHFIPHDNVHKWKKLEFWSLNSIERSKKLNVASKVATPWLQDFNITTITLPKIWKISCFELVLTTDRISGIQPKSQ